MEEDFYPLTTINDCKDAWCAAQFDRPSKKDGLIQAFRRDDSPFETACFFLYGVNENARYIFTDEDSGEEIILGGKELKEKGLSITISQKRASRLIFYRQI